MKRVTRSGEIRSIGTHRADDGSYMVSIGVRLDDGPDAGRTVYVDMPLHRAGEVGAAIVEQTAYATELSKRPT